MVATPIGNVLDMGERGRRVLKECRLIACEDTRVTRELLRDLGIDSKEKRLMSYHAHNYKSSGQELLRIVKNENQSLAVVSDAGTLGISDPGAELANMCMSENIPMQSIPGPCAATALLQIAGFDLTSGFLFIGFLPSAKRKGASKAERDRAIQDVINEERTCILYESPHRIVGLLHSLRSFGAGERRVVIGRELTKRYETVYHGTIKECLGQLEQEEAAPEHGIKGELCIALGPSPKSKVDSNADWSLLVQEKMSSYDMKQKNAIKEVALEHHVKRSVVYNHVIKKKQY